MPIKIPRCPVCNEPMRVMAANPHFDGESIRSFDIRLYCRKSSHTVELIDRVDV